MWERLMGGKEPEWLRPGRRGASASARARAGALVRGRMGENARVPEGASVGM